jgi:hypothetical protein
VAAINTFKPYDSTELRTELDGEFVQYETYVSEGKDSLEVFLLMNDEQKLEGWRKKVGEKMDYKLLYKKETVISSGTLPLERVEIAARMETTAWVRLAFGNCIPNLQWIVEEIRPMVRDEIKRMLR